MGYMNEFSRHCTEHFKRVRKMMQLFKQDTPEKPTEPDEKTRILRARLILEEALETIQDGLGVSVQMQIPSVHESCGMVRHYLYFDRLIFEIEKPFDIVETVDGCADISVVTTGTLVAIGVPDNEVLFETDQNNINKVANGTVDENGKFQKHPDHKPPRIKELVDFYSS